MVIGGFFMKEHIYRTTGGKEIKVVGLLTMERMVELKNKDYYPVYTVDYTVSDKEKKAK
jgi:hypothetical protein